MELQKKELIDSTVLIQNIEVACLKGNRSVETDQVDISWILTSHQTLIRLERNEKVVFLKKREREIERESRFSFDQFLVLFESIKFKHECE